jgi:hypothetical protein
MGEFLVKVRHLPGRSAITGSGTSPIAFVPGCPSGTPTSSAPAPTTMRSTKCCGSSPAAETLRPRKGKGGRGLGEFGCLAELGCDLSPP